LISSHITSKSVIRYFTEAFLKRQVDSWGD
jgi:hypothetical protein